MKIEMARMGVFLVFLLAAAWQDFGTKQISSEILWLSGTAALVCQSLSVLCLAFIKEAGAEETVLWFFLNAWGPYLAGVLPGAALLALSWLGCGIGAGDGFFFLVSGLLLGLRHNLLFLCGTVLCCGLFGLGYYVWSRLKGNDAGGKTELPLLPFGGDTGDLDGGVVYDGVSGIWSVECRECLDAVMSETARTHAL